MASPVVESATVRPRSFASHPLRIVHPFPTLLNTAAVAGLAFVAEEGVPDGSVLVRMLVVMLCIQSAIGIANDIVDRELDAAAKPWKPLVAGTVALPVAIAACITLIVTAAVLAATLGAPSCALAMLGLACGLAYDVRLKRTLVSALPFMIAIPTLPAWVWVTLDAWEDALWWIWPLGALIGLSLHLANTLPDIEEDAAHGVRGMAHALGEDGSRALSYASFAGALALALLAGLAVDGDRAVLLATVGVGGAMLVASMVLTRSGASWAGQASFALLGIAAAVCATGWLASVT
jgi:4-hydroxybenzoate polyprenyltransferase